MKNLTKTQKDRLLSEQLFKAILDNDLNLVKLFVEMGAPLERVNKIGDDAYRKLTPLLQALTEKAEYKCDTKIIEYLLYKGASVHATDNTGFTALHQTAYNHRDFAEIKLLLQYGADINAKDQDGATPLMVACGYNGVCECFETTLFLFERGADIEIRRNNGENIKDMFEELDHPDFDQFHALINTYYEQKTLEAAIKGDSLSEGLSF